MALQGFASLSANDEEGESTAAWQRFFGDLNARSLKRTAFVIVDGAPGLKAALAKFWGNILWRYSGFTSIAISSPMRPVTRMTN